LIKRHFLFLIGLFLLVMTACGTTHLATTGALVNVYHPNLIKEGLVCTTQGKSGISFMYVGPETVSGQVTSHEKEVIAQYAKAVLGDTRFINAVSVPSMEGEYPDLSIRVHQFFVNTKRERDRIVRDGVFQASFSIRQAGILECSTSEPILIEKHFEVPYYKSEALPSELRIKEIMVKEAVRRVIRQFVPVKSRVLRPAKMEGTWAKKAAAMINAGNCRGAYEVLKLLADNPNCTDAGIIYNAGVALECLAWNEANDQPTQARYLNKAMEYYHRAAFLKPNDADMQRAVRDVSYELETVFASFGRQQKTKGLLKEYKTPTGF